MTSIEQHIKMRKLIESKIIIPGIIENESGVKVYQPISLEKYIELIEEGNTEKLAYNTYSMGRGVFTLGDNGEIINFKGVDSRLKDEENIAVGKTKAKVYDISKMIKDKDDMPYSITVVNFPNDSSEIRVRGASQLQNLINEKQKLEQIRQKDKEKLIKLPQITQIKPFSGEFCEQIGLPKIEPITKEFINKLQSKENETRTRTGGRYGNYAYICLKYMLSIGMPINMRNQSWQEYFLQLSEEEYSKIKEIPDLQVAIKKQDEEYELGASFGQTTRILKTPFRIMDLEHFIEQGNIDGVSAILEYTNNQYEGDYLSSYSETMAKNLAGFMNLQLAYNNWAHRQDFSLSGEMCDDAYDDISGNVELLHTDKKYEFAKKNLSMYYNQIYLFASNMKVIEDAYTMTGKEIPKNYREQFVDTFIENLKNPHAILQNIYSENSKNFKDTLKYIGGESAIRNFQNYEEYINKFKEIVQVKIEKHNKEYREEIR